MATSNSELLTIAEAAELVKVDPSTIRRWIKSGRLHALRPGPRTVRLRRSEIEGEQRPRRAWRYLVGDDGPDPIPVPPLTEAERRRGLEALERLRRLQEQQVEKYGVFESPSWELLHELREERARQILGEE